MPTYKEHDVLTGETETHSTDDNTCHNCGSVTENEPISANSSVTPGMCLCNNCQSEYEQAKRRGNVDIEYGPNSDTVVNVNIKGIGRSSTDSINYNKKECAVCEGRAAGDCQLLGKIVCQSCFSRAKKGDIREIRQTLEKKYNNNDLRDYTDSSGNQDIEIHGNHAQNAGNEGIKTDSETSTRPDDYEEWTVEQWQNAYVEDEINLIALEIGVEHALRDNMTFDGPGSEKFERSVEIATELSDGPIKEQV